MKNTPDNTTTATQLNKAFNVYTTKFAFTHLPDFAKFIRENHIEEFTTEQLRFCKEVNLPLLSHLSHIPHDELVKMSINGQIDFLKSLEENRIKERTENALKTWEQDEMKIISKNDLSWEDFISGTFVRKKSFLKFIPYYTSDVNKVIELVSEIDICEYYTSLTSSETYIRILKKHLNEHAHFIEKIANTIPGAVCVYNPVTFEEVFTNNKLYDLGGYDKDEAEKGGLNIITMTHPEDLDKFYGIQKKILEQKNGNVITMDLRLKQKKGGYAWMKNYNTVFKRNEDGVPEEVISILLNTHEAKLNEENLLKSQEQLLEAQELAGIGSFILDTETDEIEVTPQFLKIFEINSLAERKYNWDKIHPADVAKVKEAREKAIKENGVFDSEYRFLPNGKEKIIWVRGLVSEKNGKKIMKGTVMDVTERKHMLYRLQRSENLYMQAQALSHIGNWTWDLIQQKLDWSEEMYHIHEFIPGSIVDNNSIYEIMHPDDVENVKKIIRDSLAKLTSFDMHYRIITHKGREKMLHVKGQILSDDLGVPYKVLGTLQDVTKEFLVSKQLKESREFIQKIANTTPSIIASYNVHTGQYSYINKSIQKLLGYNPDTVLEKGVSFFMDIVHPDDMELMQEKNAKVLEQANSYYPKDGDEMIVEFKYRMRNTNGEYRWFHTFGTIFSRDSTGKVEQVLNVSIDITDQENAEQMLYEKNVELQQSNANLEEFAYIASHDLKEPLRKISTFGDRLLTTNLDRITDEGKMYLEKIVHSTKRMQTMISDLMVISTINNDKQYEHYDLNHLIDEVLNTLEYSIDEKNATITYDKLPKLNIVVSQFRQLFQNLISNALKFSKKDVNPTVHISARYLNLKEQYEYQLPGKNRYLKIEVADNGIGFEMEYANKIFTIFQRLYGKSEYEGNGIGLAICKKIVENHNGFIYATSTPGKGATFTIVLPANV